MSSSAFPANSSRTILGRADSGLSCTQRSTASRFHSMTCAMAARLRGCPATACCWYSCCSRRTSRTGYSFMYSAKRPWSRSCTATSPLHTTSSLPTSPAVRWCICVSSLRYSWILCTSPLASSRLWKLDSVASRPRATLCSTTRWMRLSTASSAEGKTLSSTSTSSFTVLSTSLYSCPSSASRSVPPLPPVSPQPRSSTFMNIGSWEM
mmetsp:Transcript_3907/g.11072  ORF Transcript_3907/g.11072 Transcript_3907/m.11072 type:complete len:208 (-) Transcript_3907:185-808(-)